MWLAPCPLQNLVQSIQRSPSLYFIVTTMFKISYQKLQLKKNVKANTTCKHIIKLWQRETDKHLEASMSCKNMIISMVVFKWTLVMGRPTFLIPLTQWNISLNFTWNLCRNQERQEDITHVASFDIYNVATELKLETEHQYKVQSFEFLAGAWIN